MDCERCGCELDEDAFFCNGCGARVGAEFIGVGSEQIEAIPTFRMPNEGMTVDPPSLPYIPPLGRTVVAGLAIIGVAVAVIAFTVIGWVLLPQLFSSFM